MLGSVVLVAAAVLAHAQIDASVPVRELTDPHTGRHWLLLRDEANPAGPARMVLSNVGPLFAGSRAATTRQLREAASLPPVLRAGDRVVLEEHSTTANAWLEAVAMGRAAVGQSVDVRLKIGGRTVHATALANGRAMVTTGAEPRR